MSRNPLKIRLNFEELRLLGLRGSLYRIGHEFSTFSGLKSLLHPVSRNFKKAHNLLSLKRWREIRPSFFIPKANRTEFQDIVRSYFTENDEKQMIQEANQLIEGKIRCFSKWTEDYGYPIDWHRNPIKKKSWPSNIHWSKIMSFENVCGDIKLTWEINRFSHVYLLARVYLLTGDSKWVSAFRQQLKSWEEANPYRAGVNWSSGQELAIRSLGWMFALYVFGDDDNFKEEDFQRIQRLLYLHAEHIHNNINFARYSVHNNHLIGEALGLYAIGSLFPWFNKSGTFKQIGREILERDCLKQFFNDGGYCQLSHNYHRLALHYYIWACRIGECLNERFTAEIYEIIRRSGEFLASFLNKDGKLANWGANDGALLNPLSFCDYSDFRPLLNVIRYLTSCTRAFGDGVWNEELLWFFGPESLKSSVEPYNLKSMSYPVTGLHIVRQDEQNFITLRCGSVISRYGQADQLHVDIWWKGLNIALDGGSYLYNDELRYHRYLMGTLSHNTVVVDKENQMYLHRRFKWLYWTKARLIDSASEGILEGEHYGYERAKGKVTHRRKIKVFKKGSYLVEDKLIQKYIWPHIYTLHWLINDFEYHILKKEDKHIIIKFYTSKGDYYLSVEANKNAQINIVRAYDDGQYVEGWHSRYYGEKLPALSIKVSCSSNNGLSFTSLFTDDLEFISKNIKEFYK